MLNPQKLLSLVARQKFRFDLGQSFMSLINFSFVVLVASDKLATIIDVPAKVMLALLVPGAVTVVWFFGYILDQLEFARAYQDELNKRNVMLTRMHENVINQHET